MKSTMALTLFLFLASSLLVKAVEADKIIGLDNVNNFTHEMKCTKLSETEALQRYELGKINPLFLENALGFTVASHDLVLRHNNTEVVRFRFANTFVNDRAYVNRRNESVNTPTFDRCNREQKRADNDTEDSVRVAKAVKGFIYTKDIIYKKANENACYKKAIVLRERAECAIDPGDDYMMANPENGKCPVLPQVARVVVPCSGQIVFE